MPSCLSLFRLYAGVPYLSLSLYIFIYFCGSISSLSHLFFQLFPALLYSSIIISSLLTWAEWSLNFFYQNPFNAIHRLIIMLLSILSHYLYLFLYNSFLKTSSNYKNLLYIYKYYKYMIILYNKIQTPYRAIKNYSYIWTWIIWCNLNYKLIIMTMRIRIIVISNSLEIAWNCLL